MQTLQEILETRRWCPQAARLADERWPGFVPADPQTRCGFDALAPLLRGRLKRAVQDEPLEPAHEPGATALAEPVRGSDPEGNPHPCLLPEGPLAVEFLGHCGPAPAFLVRRHPDERPVLVLWAEGAFRVQTQAGHLAARHPGAWSWDKPQNLFWMFPPAPWGETAAPQARRPRRPPRRARNGPSTMNGAARPPSEGPWTPENTLEIRGGGNAKRRVRSGETPWPACSRASGPERGLPKAGKTPKERLKVPKPKSPRHDRHPRNAFRP